MKKGFLAFGSMLLALTLASCSNAATKSIEVNIPEKSTDLAKLDSVELTQYYAKMNNGYGTKAYISNHFNEYKSFIISTKVKRAESEGIYYCNYKYVFDASTASTYYYQNNYLVNNSNEITGNYEIERRTFLSGTDYISMAEISYDNYRVNGMFPCSGKVNVFCATPYSSYYYDPNEEYVDTIFSLNYKVYSLYAFSPKALSSATEVYANKDYSKTYQKNAYEELFVEDNAIKYWTYKDATITAEQEYVYSKDSLLPKKDFNLEGYYEINTTLFLDFGYNVLYYGLCNKTYVTEDYCESLPSNSSILNLL